MKINKNIMIFNFILIFMLILLLTDCQSRSDEDDQVSFLVGMSQANLMEPWRIAMDEEIREEALKHKDLRVIFTDAAQNSQKQIKDVQELMKEGIDLLIISPNESKALTPIVAEAYKKMPVILLDRAVEGYDYSLYIGPDNNQIGKKAGQFILDLLGEKGGNIIEIQGLSGSPPVRDRNIGFHEAIAQNKNIKILDSIVADWQRDKAEDQLKKILKKYPKVDVIFAQNDPMAMGAYKAAKDIGMSNIKFVGVDGLSGPDGGLELVQKGMLKGTFTCTTGGKEAIQYAIDILNHEMGIPKKIILRSSEITSKNVDEYIKTINENFKLNNVTGRKIVMGFAQVGEESKWRLANSQSIKEAAIDAGIELKFINAKTNQERQIQAMREFIKEKVDVIAFSPLVETGWDEVLKEAKVAGIPVICSDRTVKVEDDSLYITFIGSDFIEEGRRAARWLVGKLNTKKPVRIIELQGTLGSAPEIDRKKGFEEILKEYPNFKIIKSQSADFTSQMGEKVMKQILKEKLENFQVIYAHNDDMAIGAIKALEERGIKPGKDVTIVSIDGVKDAFKAMKEGKLNCTVECNPLLGPQLMKVVKDIATGKRIPMRIITNESVFPAELAKSELSNRSY